MVKVVLLVVEDGKAGLVIELLKAIHSESAWVVHIVELARFQSFVVVGLSLTSNPSPVKISISNTQWGKVKISLSSYFTATHLLQNVSLLGMLVGGILLLPSDQNLGI